MSRLTVVFGVVLLALGVASFVLTGSAHPTSLIPSGFGLLLCVSGVLANTEDARRRMLWMHVAATAGLLGFLGGASMVIVEYRKAHGAPLAHPIAVEEQAAMAVVCAIFTGLCVRSFIAARRRREA